MSASKSPLSRTLRRVALAVLTVLIIWLFFAFQLFYNVRTPPLKKADAVVMLGGASKERLPEALKLRNELGAPILVLSNTGTPGNASADSYCEAHSLDPSVICFLPEPMDTRGEADAVGLLASERGWKSIVVVTSKYHVARSERLMNQCTPSKVQLAATDPELSAAQWLRRFVIETGGLLTVFLNPECDSPIR
ncbi:YdcF family protein [Arthrobacter psychrochitiniphilus]|uniref:YdcF family protein n=1 Tax=Arthrobacter psychrochitiniphilus TaxID=291045 RepID=A0A2V3DUK0_9MICC|nr:YdcF family protein [Arthrobacter psychrochitiniphilus]NYG18023.1 uncharacterized SAM-binding protein YcdF (DUF218 family) [Arthrobacter psychrochitiniphilus]PXA64248.1 YdcF family protein [Arthrobacter psychrochitiniphilus]